MTSVLIRLGIMIAIFAAVFIVSQVLIAAVWTQRAEKSAVNRRLQLLRSARNREDVSVSLLKNAPLRITPDSTFRERLWVRFARMVMMSALPLGAKQIILAMVAGFFGLLCLILFLTWTAGFELKPGLVQLVIIIAAAATIGIPMLVIARLAMQRRKRMEEQFPLALDVFTRSLRAGHPVAVAIDVITQEVGDPIGSEFGLVSDEVSYGAELTDALLAMAERWDFDDMRMFVVSVSIQTETGGNLAEILENLTKVIRARASMYLKVRALSSEGRMTGWMLTALPLLTLVSMFLFNPRFYLDIADDPIFTYGFFSLVLLYAIGVFSIRRLVDLRV